MFKTVAQLKEFILWAKAQKVQEIHVGKVAVVFSAYAIAEAAVDEPSDFIKPRTPNEERDTSKTLVDDVPEMADNDEELLFYSSKP